MLPLLLYYWRKKQWFHFAFFSGNAAWKFLGLDFVLLFDLQLSAFDISSANFSVATVNNKVMLFLLSVFPILLLLFALELKLFALAVLTQSFRSPKLHISTVCKIGQLLTEMLPFSHAALTCSQLPAKQLQNVSEERKNTGLSFSFDFSPYLTKWEAGNPCTVTAALRLDSAIWKVSLLYQPTGHGKSFQVHKKWARHHLTLNAAYWVYHRLQRHTITLFFSLYFPSLPSTFLLFPQYYQRGLGC